MRKIKSPNVLDNFQQLGLSKPILRAIQELGFDSPSEIQKKAIPILMQDYQDFIGLAQTGTGKTAAFGLPVLDRIDPHDSNIQALILTPTRELGQQVARQLELFSKYLSKIHVVAVYGGAPIERQIKSLKKPTQVVIATPGRLVDLIRRKAIRLNHLEYLVLDEADEMLNMGFKDDLDTILDQTPKNKITLLFSATMGKEIRSIAKNYMHDPVEVKINPKQQTNDNIEHQFAVMKRSDKMEALLRILDVNPDLRGIVFCRTKRETQDLAEKLIVRSYKADALHGDLSQPQRDRVMRRFRDEELQVLVATDIAARGIDVSELTHVFHYSLPDENAYYTHRSGRTARAGKKGISLALVDERDRSKIKRIENEIKVSFQKVQIPSADEVVGIRIENWCRSLLDLKQDKSLDSKTLNLAFSLFGELSKEELIEKILTKELVSISSKNSKNLNHDHSNEGSDRRKEKNNFGRKNRNRKGRSFRNETNSGDRNNKSFKRRKKRR